MSPPVSQAICSLGMMHASESLSHRCIASLMALALQPARSQHNACPLSAAIAQSDFLPCCPLPLLVGTMTLPVALVVLAALAWACANGSLAQAGRLLVSYCQLLGLAAPANPPNFVNYWRGRLTAAGEVDSHAGNAGRPYSLSPQMVESAYQGIIGWRAAGRSRPYASKLECAQQCPEVRQVLMDSGVTIETLLRRIKEVHPKFAFTRQRVRWHLSDDNKQQRLTICQHLLQAFRQLLHRVVFVDAKTLWVWEEDVWGWVDTSVPNCVHGIRPAYHRGKVVRLKYYAAVHSRLGPVWIRFYTGTSGMPYNRDGHNFRVSSCSKELWQALGLHMQHSLMQLASPVVNLAGVTPDVLVHPQPQHTPPLLHSSLSIQPVFQPPFSQTAVSVFGLGHQPSAVPFSMHFNQQATRYSQNNIPPFLLKVHHHTLMHHRLCRLGQAECFNSIQLNQLLFVTQVIQQALPLAAATPAHMAVQCCRAVVGRSHGSVNNMFRTRPAVTIVIQLVFTVTGLVLMCHWVELPVTSLNGCVVVLCALPPCLAATAALAPLLPCTCRQPQTSQQQTSQCRSLICCWQT